MLTCTWAYSGCQLDGITEVMEELDKVVTSGTSGKPSSQLHTDTLWALQSPTSAADWLSRLQKKDKEKKELEKYVRMYVVQSCVNKILLSYLFK